MLFSTVSSFAIVALAGQAIAEPMRQPYKLKFARMSERSIFGLDRRGNDGYSPEQEFCHDGKTCAEACGKGYQQCPSKDDVTHCYNKTAKQTCCPGMTGESCDDGYFCSSDDKGATWCCPDSMTLKQCAIAYNLPGSLISESTPTTSKTKAPSTKVTTTVKNAESATTTQDYGSSTTEPPSAPASTTAPPAATSTSSSASSSSSSSSPAPTAPANGIVEAGSDNVRVPANGIVLLAAAVFAALL